MAVLFLMKCDFLSSRAACFFHYYHKSSENWGFFIPREMWFHNKLAECWERWGTGIYEKWMFHFAWNEPTTHIPIISTPYCPHISLSNELTASLFIAGLFILLQPSAVLSSIGWGRVGTCASLTSCSAATVSSALWPGWPLAPTTINSCKKVPT